MKIAYDKYYQTENLFGKPYPELMDFFADYPPPGKILDMGCGQGRDAIPLARLGFEVLGIDHSQVGIEQMNLIAQNENLQLRGVTADVYAFDNFAAFDYILLDSMFHFAKPDREKEIGLLDRICSRMKAGCLLIVCIQDTGDKVKILNVTIDSHPDMKRIEDQAFTYVYEDHESKHRSESRYRMLVVQR